MIIPEEARNAIIELLAQRRDGATICPSEAARVLADRADAQRSGNDWRSMMPAVHGAIDQLVDERLVVLTWKGKSLLAPAGPYRIGRAPGDKI